MISWKSAIRCLVIAAMGILSSCIDSREEYWLQADGSGRAEMTYHLPAAAAAAHGGESGIREMIDGFLKQTPEITTSSCEVGTHGERLRVTITITFRSALAMRDVMAGDTLKSLPTAAAHLAGEVTADLRGRTLDFNREISPSKALPGAVFMPASRFAGHRLIYIMHLPAAATESNASRVENDGHTLVWDIPLAQALKAPVVTRFKMRIPIPWSLVTAVAIPLSLATCGLIVLRRRKPRPPAP